MSQDVKTPEPEVDDAAPVDLRDAAPDRVPQELSILTGATVSRCIVDDAFTLDCRTPAGERVTVRIDGPFVFAAGGTRHHLDPDADSVGLGPALVVVAERVESARFTPEGRLELAFGSGETLLADADEMAETWEVIGAGWHVVCLPDGAIAMRAHPPT